MNQKNVEAARGPPVLRDVVPAAHDPDARIMELVCTCGDVLDRRRRSDFLLVVVVTVRHVDVQPRVDRGRDAVGGTPIAGL